MKGVRLNIKLLAFIIYLIEGARMSRTLQPLYDRLLIKRIDSEERTQGGIIIPDNAKESPLEGEIVALGQGKILQNGEIRPLSVKKGDHILFVRYAETEVEINDQKYIILREDDILGVFI